MRAKARTAKRRKRVVRRTLTRRELDRAYPAIVEAIALRAKAWRSHGWAVVGRGDALRIEIAVSVTMLHPREAVTAIELPRIGLLKPAVRSSGAGLRTPVVCDVTTDESVTNAAVPEPFAPGSRIRVQAVPVQAAGVACFVLADGHVYMITCGHVFQPNSVGACVFVNGQVVANLTHNFLDDANQLDAAYCLVSPTGRQFANASTTAPTWYGAVLPAAKGQGRAAVFWPTNDGASDAITTSIDSASCCESGLFNAFWSLSLCGLVRTEPITTGGDSGSLLVVADSYYASCSGQPSWSYYTPLQTVLDRMGETFSEVSLWSPS